MTETPYDNSWLTDYINGEARLVFDFAAGTLSGEMTPNICPWDCYGLGVYKFVDTVYSSGSTTFSGEFSIDGRKVDSWFEGSFTGPHAEELMARWRAPYKPYDTGFGVVEGGQMGGVWIGKKN